RAADAGEARPAARIRHGDRAREELSGVADRVALGKQGGIFRGWRYRGCDRCRASGSTSTDAGRIRAIWVGPGRAAHPSEARSCGTIEYFALGGTPRRDVHVRSAWPRISRL